MINQSKVLMSRIAEIGTNGKEKPGPELHFSPRKGLSREALIGLYPDAELINFKELGKHLLIS